MHDLVHDLAHSIMENQFPRSSSTSAPYCKIRQVCSSKHTNTTSSSIAVELSALDTILNYKHIRILKLHWTRMVELPTAVGKLKLLRHLDLSRSSIRTLPPTFCFLYNLQILILNNCRYLESLPENIRYMTNLRHILLEGFNSLSHMPYRIGELTSLKTLSLFIVGDDIGYQLDEVEHLNLGGRLEIRWLESVQNHMHAKKANLIAKPNLRDLVLRWRGECDDTSSEFTSMTDDEKLLEALEPHLNLSTLEIHWFKGREFAIWMTRMTNLTRIVIVDCGYCSHLPPLGDLPLLKYLHLENLDSLEYIMEDGEDSMRIKFPSLEELKLKCLPNLKRLSFEDDVGEILPNLETLTISWCELLILKSTSVSTLKNLSCSPLILPSFSNSNLENLSSLELDFAEIAYSTTTCNNLPEDTLQGLCSLKKLKISKAWKHRLAENWSRGLNSLTQLEIWDCKVQSCFPEGWLQHLTTLEALCIWNCKEFADVAGEIKQLHNLKRLIIGNIGDMVFLPECLQHIPSLQSLVLINLERLVSLPHWLPNLTSLMQLEIHFCRGIRSLPSSIQGMTNLEFLVIKGFSELERRCEKENGEDWHKIAHIPHLDIGFP